MRGSSSNCQGRYTFDQRVWKSKSSEDICIHPKEVPKDKDNITLISDANELSLMYRSMPSLYAVDSNYSLRKGRFCRNFCLNTDFIYDGIRLLGCTSRVMYRIDTGNVSPVKKLPIVYKRIEK